MYKWAKGFVFLVWYYIDRGDQENESGFLCKKRFFVEKIVSIQSDHGAVYLDINSLLIPSSLVLIFPKQKVCNSVTSVAS